MAPSNQMRLDTFIAQRVMETGFATDHERGIRLDASEAMTFARELLKVRTTMFEVQFPELKAMSLVPPEPDVDDTDEAFTYQTVTPMGRAELAADYSTTAPLSSVKADEATPQKIKPITGAYRYSFMEARRSAKLGKDLPRREAMATRLAIAQELDRVLSYGDTTKTGVTLYGLLTLSGTETYTTPNGAGGVKTWGGVNGKTPDEIYQDLTAPLRQVHVNSNYVEDCDTLVLPGSSFEYIQDTRMGDGSETTILNYFRRNRPNVNVIPWYRGEAAPAAEWTGKRAVFYKRSADKLTRIVPVEFEQLTPDVTSLMTTVNCHARVGGLMLYLPKSVIYMDGI